MNIRRDWPKHYFQKEGKSFKNYWTTHFFLCFFLDFLSRGGAWQGESGLKLIGSNSQSGRVKLCRSSKNTIGDVPSVPGLGREDFFEWCDFRDFGTAELELRVKCRDFALFPEAWLGRDRDNISSGIPAGWDSSWSHLS